MFSASPLSKIAPVCAVFCRFRQKRPGRATGAAFVAAVVALAGCSGTGDEHAGLGPPITGSLSVSVLGLPTGVSGSLGVTGPQGFERTLGGSATLTALQPGSYTIGAIDVVATDDHYSPTPATQDVTIIAGSNPAIASVTYALTSGKLQVDLTGVPAGATAAVDVSGPGGYHHIVAASELLSGLAPGSYTLQAPSILSGSNRYDAQPAIQHFEVGASVTAVPSLVTYALATGALWKACPPAREQRFPSPARWDSCGQSQPTPSSPDSRPGTTSSRPPRRRMAGWYTCRLPRPRASECRRVWRPKRAP